MCIVSVLLCCVVVLWCVVLILCCFVWFLSVLFVFGFCLCLCLCFVLFCFVFCLISVLCVYCFSFALLFCVCVVAVLVFVLVLFVCALYLGRLFFVFFFFFVLGCLLWVCFCFVLVYFSLSFLSFSYSFSLSEASSSSSSFRESARSVPVGGVGGGPAVSLAISSGRVAALSRSGEAAFFDAQLKLLWRVRLVTEEAAHIVESAISLWDEGVRKGDTSTVLVLLRSSVDQDRVRVVALDGVSGAMRWDSVEAGGLGTHQLAARSGIDGETFKRHLLADLDDPIESSWTNFAEDMYRQLPFHWRSSQDTALAADKWRKSNGTNVVVARHSRGITVLHAFSGRAVSKLSLEPGLHVDADGDGLVENFGISLPLRLDPKDGSLHDQHQQQQQQPAKCEGWVRVGFPASRVAAPVPICSGLTDAQRVSLSGSGPLFVPPYKQHQPWLAYHLSSGDLVVVDARLDRRAAAAPWARIVTPASWGPERGFRHVGISAFGLHLVLLVGDSSLAIASPATGKLLGTAVLEEPAIRAPVVGHIDKDKHLDIIVTTASFVQVYSVKPERASRLVGFVVLALVAVMGAVAFMLTRGGEQAKKK